MKSRKLWVGIPLIILVFAVILISCDEPVDQETLKGVWYMEPACTTPVIEFTTDGNLKLLKSVMYNTPTTYPYELSGTTLTLTGPNSQKLTTTIRPNLEYTELEVTKACFYLKKATYFKKGGGSSSPNYQVPDFVDDIVAQPVAGTYSEAQSVWLFCATEGAVIWYTLNGDEPTATASATNFKFTGPILVSEGTTTIKAIAVKSNMENAELNARYIIDTSIQVAEPTASPAGGTYGTTQTVTLTSTGADNIYYTTNGSEPTTSSTKYSSAITISSTTTLKAIAVKSSVISSVLTEQYNIVTSSVDITVTSNADSGNGTLRDALTKIGNGKKITITLSGTKTIELKRQLTVNADVTIEANGIVITPGTGYPESGDSLILIQNNKVVNIKGIHFKSGKDTDTTGKYGMGSAIYNKGSLVVESCIFSYNTTKLGGAIYNASPSTGTTVRGCTFYNNSATTSGGAIYHATGTLALVGNIFYGNKAPTNAVTSGPIVFKSGSATVRSDGYNVVDVAFGEGASQCGWAVGTGDKTFTELSVNAPIDTNTFVPVIGLRNVLPSTLPTGFPAKDFNGNDRTNRSPGAVD